MVGFGVEFFISGGFGDKDSVENVDVNFTVTIIDGKTNTAI